MTSDICLKQIQFSQTVLCCTIPLKFFLSLVSDSIVSESYVGDLCMGRTGMTHSRSLYIIVSQVFGVHPLFWGVGLLVRLRILLLVWMDLV